jgi:hypothetical protein
VVSTTPRPLYPRENPVPTVQEVGWAPAPVWTCAKKLAPTGIQSPDRPARSSVAIPTELPGPLFDLGKEQIYGITVNSLNSKLSQFLAYFPNFVTDLKNNLVTTAQGKRSVSKRIVRVSAPCSLLPVDNRSNLFSIKLARLHLSKLSSVEYIEPKYRQKV